MLTLERLLDGLSVEIEPFALCEVKGRGRLGLGPRDHPALHYTLGGSGYLDLTGRPSIAVRPHTVVVVPAGVPHQLAAAGTAAGTELPRCAPLENGWRHLSAGGGGGGILMACGRLRVTFRGAYGLFDYLSEPIVARLEDADPLRASLTALVDELANPKPGARALTRALMEQCLVLLLRRLCRDGFCTAPWLLALDDPRLGRTVEAMTALLEREHSVESLAWIAGMSRSAFARHFVEAFGRGPMDFLRELRLRRAAELLKTSDRPVKTLAGEVGYTSRSYFSRAFKNFYGVCPVEFRAGRPEGP